MNRLLSCVWLLFGFVLACSASKGNPRDADAGRGGDAATMDVGATVDAFVASLDAMQDGRAMLDAEPVGGAADAEVSADATVEEPDSGIASDLAEACTASGGMVDLMPCCSSGAVDWTPTCGGSCACSPTASTYVTNCWCTAGTCWNGATCAPPR